MTQQPTQPIGQGQDAPLRRRRLQMGLTQKELATRCGVTMVSIVRYELGTRMPSLAVLKLLMRETGLPAEAILFPIDYLRDHPTFLMEFAPHGGKRPRVYHRPKKDEDAESA